MDDDDGRRGGNTEHRKGPEGEGRTEVPVSHLSETRVDYNFRRVPSPLLPRNCVEVGIRTLLTYPHPPPPFHNVQSLRLPLSSDHCPVRIT